MSALRYEVELASSGYLYLAAELASTRFPNDAVVATMDNGNLLLWPTSGSFAGGLLLKQRNAVGDRCVLISEAIPRDAIPGKKEAVWNGKLFHLCVFLSLPVLPAAVGANTIIVEEKGRWAVYLEVGFWQTSGDVPVEVTRHRINDYPTQREAEVAASWVERAAERNVSRQLEGN